VATYQAAEWLVVGLQGYGNTPAAPGAKSELAYGVGAEATVATDRVLLLQVGRSTQGFSDLNLYVGMQFLLGPRSNKPDPAAAMAIAPSTASH
jgi:hypothetical protein